MSIQSVGEMSFDFLDSRPVKFEFSDAPLTSDAGLLPLVQFDAHLGFTAQFAAALHDSRVPSLVRQPLLSMVRQRIFGILADYEDQNDHETLRSDPVFKMAAGRLPTDNDLASQPTLSRFENEVSIADLWRLRDVFTDRFISSFKTPPRTITLDVDAFDDPTHGSQQLTFFHGHYGGYQYLPIVFTCAENDAIVLVGLRHGTCGAALGADDDIRYLVNKLRSAWPDVSIYIRGDCGFGVPALYDTCEALGVFYTFGVGMNPRVKKLSLAILEEAMTKYEQTGNTQRLFDRALYKADSWPVERRIVIKAEVNSLGTNTRAVVTNRPGWEVSPQGIYDSYAERGESENRNKELKCDLQAGRLSDHRFMANYFRLYLHAAALNLLIYTRQAIARPIPSPVALGIDTNLPLSALDEPNRKSYFNRRRTWDLLGNASAETWRTHVIKVAAEVIVRARHVIIRLSASWPHLDYFQMVCQTILQLQTPQMATG